MSRPLAIDIDGTMTRPDGGIDERLFAPLRQWDEPVVVATGKSFAYPVALCAFIGIRERVIAENGGVVLVDGDLTVDGDASAARAVASDLRAEGYPGGWPEPDMHNRWRETELSVTRSVPRDLLESLAAEYGQTIVDSGYAYHVKSPDVSKATGLRRACERLDRDPEAFVAIGDSANDAELFDLAGYAVAVANADETAIARADTQTEGAFADGVLEALGEVA
ncbi:HAD hydrolase family protein [Halobellus captivus]|uniref:HAD hydrolase family protein n=1 Tax=Halobellus captivus TaxID=2592614 RepID=UPI0011A4A8C0|nr:HAD hydrolase family protein [Halobellus captivus]